MDFDISLKAINFLVSSKCNLHCKMCDYPDGNIHRKELTYNQIQELILNALILGLKRLDLSGGEPMMRKDIYDIISFANSQDIRTLLVTNGTMIGEQEALKLVDSGISAVIISLEGFEEINDFVRGIGNYKKAINAIKCLKKHREKLDYINVGITISKLNYKELFDFTKYLIEEIGVDSISYNPFDSQMLLKENQKNAQSIFEVSDDILEDIDNQLEKIIEYSSNNNLNLSTPNYLRKIPDYFRGKKMLPSFPCCEPLTGCAIDSAGQVFGCWGQQETLCGDITKAPLLDIVKTDIYKQICKTALTLKCKGCLKACYVNAYNSY